MNDPQMEAFNNFVKQLDDEQRELLLEKIKAHLKDNNVDLFDDLMACYEILLTVFKLFTGVAPSSYELLLNKEQYIKALFETPPSEELKEFLDSPE